MGTRIPHKDTVAIVIERFGNTLGAQHLAEQQPVSVRIFLGAEHGRHDGTGGIVDGRQQRTVGLVGTKPGMPTAVDLEQHAGLWKAVATTTMAWGRARMRGRTAALPQDPPDAGATEKDAMLARQQLGEMTVVTVGVALGHQGAHLIPQGVGKPPGFGLTGVAMDEGGGPLALERGFQPPELPFGDLEELRRLRGRTLTSNQSGQDVEPLLLTGREGNGSIAHHAPSNGSGPKACPSRGDHRPTCPTDRISDQFLHPTDISSEHLHPDRI